MPLSLPSFSADQWTAHGFCLSWDPPLVGLHVVSDGLIAASYYSIPLAIGLLVRRRRDLAYSWVAWLFAAFITACGTTHLFAIWTLWHPDYLADGLIKAVTAIVSVATAMVLWPLLPKMAALPSLSGILAANQQLQAQIRERDAAVAALERETAERLKAEAMLRQSQKMEAIGQLTGGVAHDFNNLLQVVQSNLEALSERLDDDDRRRRYLSRALAGAERGANVIQQLLAFSRRQSLQPLAFNVAERIATLGELLRSTLGGKITLELPDASEVWYVDADPHQFETALLNLAINARDAMPDGGRLTIDVADISIHDDGPTSGAEIEPGNYVAVRVRDSGTGMTAEVREAAFEPFFTTKPVGHGTGLGLSQVYGFVKQSRGHVTLQSAPGEGTEVVLYLLRARAGQAADPGANGGLASTPSAGASSTG